MHGLPTCTQTLIKLSFEKHRKSQTSVNELTTYKLCDVQNMLLMLGRGKSSIALLINEVN